MTVRVYAIATAALLLSLGSIAAGALARRSEHGNASAISPGAGNPNGFGYRSDRRG
jgi:hypothetical protein